jgi:hypothetical protein
LTKEDLKKRKLFHIDIKNDDYFDKNGKLEPNPTEIELKNEVVGDLKKEWKEIENVITVYFRVNINFGYFGLQKNVEKFLFNETIKKSRIFYRNLYAYSDQWGSYSEEDVNKMILKTKTELEVLKGMNFFEAKIENIDLTKIVIESEESLKNENDLISGKTSFSNEKKMIPKQNQKI